MAITNGPADEGTPQVVPAPQSHRSGAFDSAALSGACLAAVLAIMIDPGPFDLMNLAVGITLLLLIIGFETWPRSGRRAVALAATTSFIFLLVVGPLAELCYGGDFDGEVRNRELDTAIRHDWLLPAIWAGSTILLSVTLWLWKVRPLRENPGR